MIIDPSLRDEVQNLVMPFFVEEQLDLVELNLKPAGREIVVEILADKEFGGITLDKCAELNRKIGNKLEEEDIIPESYTIRVFSPGLDRPMKTGRDFNRALYRPARFFLSEPIENKIEYVGVIMHATEESVKIEIDARELLIPLEKIKKAVQIII